MSKIKTNGSPKKNEDVVEISPSGIKLLINLENNLLDLFLNNNVEISHSCEGNATCGTCRVIVKSDLSVLPARQALEQEIADERKFNDDERLSCQLCPFNGLVVSIPPVKGKKK